MNYQNRKIEHTTFEEQLIIQASLYNKSFSYNKIEPSVFFWKQITANPQDPPLCLVPDTLVLNEKQSQLIWIYTDENLRIKKQTNISFKDFISKLTTYSSPNELVAILKRPIFNQKLTYSNDFRLLNSKYLANASQQQIGQKQQVLCLQRFIKSNGPKAFICRTVYSTQKSSQCFLITNSRNFFEKNENENKKFTVKAGDKSIIVKSKQGRNLEQTVKYLKNIIKHLIFIRGIEINEIVGDFIKDQLGNWWLINIKAFKVIQKVKKNPKSKKQIFSNQQIQKERYQKTKTCRYCQKSYLQSELTFKMTMKMIIEVDKYLLHLGKEYGWLKRSDISNIDSYFLYQEHRVCERCFRLYSQIQQLMQIEKKLLIKQGHNLIAEPKELIFTQTNQEHLRLQAKNKQIYRLNSSIPEIVSLGPNTNITVVDNCPMKNDEIINKMFRFRLIIYLNEIDEVSGVKTNTNYFLQFSLFGKKSKYKLNLGLVEKSKTIPLNKLKVFYFFANSIESLQNQYLSSNFSLIINISQQCKQSHQKKTIGILELPFKDLVIPINRKRDFYKFFHVEGISYGWGLEASIGVIPSQTQVTTAKVSFEKTYGQIYIPNQNYYFCDHLTEEWIDLIKTKCEKSMNRRLTMLSNKKYSYISQICDSRRKQRDSWNMKSSRGEPVQSDQQMLSQIDLNRGSKQQEEEETKWQQQLYKQIRKYEAENQKFQKKIKKQQYNLLC